MKYKYKNNYFLISLLLGAILHGIPQAYANDKSSFNKTVELFDSLSLDDLLNYEVDSATKTTRKINNAPGIVSVYSAEDIKKMGLNKLSDLFVDLSWGSSAPCG